MNNKESFDFKVKAGLLKSDDDCEAVQVLVNTLIEALYEPVEGERQSRVDNTRSNKFAIDDEPINWGDLKCIEVTKMENHYNVLIDEAAPDACPTFCGYIERFMESWGWNVTVKTEW